MILLPAAKLLFRSWIVFSQSNLHNAKCAQALARIACATLGLETLPFDDLAKVPQV
jgi:hypothetical protein